MAIVSVISGANICLVYTKIVPGREIHFTVRTVFWGSQNNNVQSKKQIFLGVLFFSDFIQQTIHMLCGEFDKIQNK